MTKTTIITGTKLSLLALFTVLSTAIFAFPMNGAYVSIGAASGAAGTAQTQTYQTFSTLTQSNQDKDSAGAAYSLNVGYRFALSSRISWSLGAEYLVTSSATNGHTSDESGSALYDYSYKTNTQSALVDSRLYYTFPYTNNNGSSFSTYVGLLFGKVTNVSDNYTQSTEPKLNFTKHSNSSSAAGVELGADYNLNAHNTLGVNVRYLSLGQQGFASYDDQYQNHFELNKTEDRTLVGLQYSYRF